MGEAKRRKKLDSNYGKIPLFRALEDYEKEARQIVDELHSENEIEMTILVYAQKFPDNYQEIRAQFAEWLENRLSKYRKQDQEILANYLLSFFTTTYEEYEMTPVTLFCFSEILKYYFPLKTRRKMEDYIEKISPNFEAEFGLKTMS